MKKYLSIVLVSLLFGVPAVSHAQVADASSTRLTHAQYQADVQLLISLIEQLISLEHSQAIATPVVQASTQSVGVMPTSILATTTQTTATTTSSAAPVVYTQNIETQNTMTGAVTTTVSTSTTPYGTCLASSPWGCYPEPTGGGTEGGI